MKKSIILSVIYYCLILISCTTLSKSPKNFFAEQEPVIEDILITYNKFLACDSFITIEVTDFNNKDFCVTNTKKSTGACTLNINDTAGLMKMVNCENKESYFLLKSTIMKMSTAKSTYISRRYVYTSSVNRLDVYATCLGFEDETGQLVLFYCFDMSTIVEFDKVKNLQNVNRNTFYKYETISGI